MSAASGTFLFPSDVIKPKLADEHFRSEAEAAVSLGFNVELLDHDAVVAGELELGLRGIEGPGSNCFYRGWMLSPSRYAAMFHALAERGVQLRTTPDNFCMAHHLPLWFPTMEGVTPHSVWTTGDDWAAFDEALLGFGEGAAVLKDYSKSEKHYWHEAMFIPDVQDLAAARAVAERFVELRGSSFDSGFVLRRFEDLSDIEARSWWIDGESVGVSAHPDAPDSEIVDFDSDLFSSQVSELGLPFVTIDVALTADSGTPRVVEVGDGQVSDRPASLDPVDFIRMVTRQE